MLRTQGGNALDRGREAAETGPGECATFRGPPPGGRPPTKVKELKAGRARFARQAVPPKVKPKPKGFVSARVWGELPVPKSKEQP